MTLYQLIKASNHTQRFAHLVDKYASELVKVLNATDKNITLLVPSDDAFARLEKHLKKRPGHHKCKKPPPELVSRFLHYHVVPSGRYTAWTLALHTKTLPTALKEGGNVGLGDHPQRLRVRVGLGGLRVNFFSRVILADFPARNGILHGLSLPLIPPPPQQRLIRLMPTHFSTLMLALNVTGVGREVAELKPRAGGTLFAPSNHAFAALGPKANAFLFSPPGLRYLAALLRYHVVVNQTLYSDAFYGPPSSGGEDGAAAAFPRGRHYHVDLPTLLGGKALGVDVMKWLGFVTMTVNKHVHIGLKDLVARDGVVHVADHVIIPCRRGKKEGGDGEAFSVEELKEILRPYVETEAGQEEL